jgi:hypothetical protein
MVCLYVPGTLARQSGGDCLHCEARRSLTCEQGAFTSSQEKGVRLVPRTIGGRDRFAATRGQEARGDVMVSLLGSDSVALRPAFVALALGAATLALIIRGATIRRRLARVALRSQPPRRAAASAALEAVYLRGDITHEDYVELSRRLRGR